ncbi:hypothetical protein D9615_009268 [Tricholomella constricta]|uniref:thioredoxin-dependent peroxiredoxin n=1 Tax=Tricholomella constricta TaxID=117010 RepID=A0A8H5GWG0_9AGAR|nr:hypothetical protein D9615_009268 [Tricholomella constricta]
MPPRKASATASTEPPRRSSRIVSQPKEEPKVATKAAAGSKKRPATAAAASDDAAAPEDGSSAMKKAKSGKAKSDEDDPLAAEEAKLAKIEIGDVLPGVTLKNEKGEDIDVAGLALEKGVVFFLVPKADTPGCTNQACGFRDIYPDFTSLNYDVYCLSADSPAAQTKWQTKKELPYPLISDPKRVLITALGAGEGGKTKRSHFIFEKGGRLLDKRLPVNAKDSPNIALEFIKSL